MTVKQLTGHHFEFLSLKGGCTGLSESSLVKMSNCWKHIINVCQMEVKQRLVRGDRDSRANLMPIYGDLYQIKLKGITNENHLVTHLDFTSGRHYDVIKITYIVSVQFKRYAHCILWRSGLSCIVFANFSRNAPN